MGQVCGNVNRNLKWAFVETGNLIVINQHRLAGTHAVRLYQRIKRAKNHQKAVVAVARRLAEGAWWVLTKQEVYRDGRERHLSIRGSSDRSNCGVKMAPRIAVWLSSDYKAVAKSEILSVA